MRGTIRIALKIVVVLSMGALSAVAQQPRSAAIVGFPLVLEKLDLTAEQRQQIEAIVSKQDTLFLSAWQEFTIGYQQTLKAEAVLLAAIEVGFNDAQRQKAQDERRKTIKLTAAPISATTGGAKTDPGPAGVALTPEQVAAVNKLQEKYHVHLAPMTRDIQNSHNRMLAIEMEKFLEIQKVLNKDQLTKLNQMLESGEAAKIARLTRAEGN